MQFISTRGEEKVSGAQAIVQGISKDGGLFVPAEFPAVTSAELESMLEMDYAERAALILSKYFDEYDQGELLKTLEKAYSKFEDGDPAPLVKVENGMFMLELYHGPSCSHKDLSLPVLPYLLKKGCEKLGIKEKLLLLVATSGDAGKAALDSFQDMDGVKLAVFYPDDGASKMQKLQLSTQDGENLDVVAVRGTFDDCKAGVRKLLSSEKCRDALREKGYVLSDVSSLNLGVIALEICYYFSAYLDLVSSEQVGLGDKVNFTVPAGNFGSLIAAYYAYRMGLPVGTLLAASNKNSATVDFLRRGTLDIKRPLYKTMSPSLDVLSAANLERLIFETSGRDASLTKERMTSLSEGGKYSVRSEEVRGLAKLFYADHTSEDDTVDCIYEFFTEYGYAMDTHTGVAMNVALRYEEKLEDDVGAEKRPMVVVFMASPYKFPQDVLYALTGNDVKDSYKGVKRINLLTAMKVPECLKAIRYKPPRFKTVISADKMYQEVMSFIGE